MEYIIYRDTHNIANKYGDVSHIFRHFRLFLTLCGTMGCQNLEIAR